MKKAISLLGMVVAFSAAAQQAGNSAPDFKGARALSEINKDKSAEAYPWISPDGLRLYYTSGVSQEIMMAQRTTTSENFSAPVSASIPLKNPTSCWLSADELHAYVSMAHQLYFLERKSRTESFSSPEEIALNGLSGVSFYSDASLDATEKHLFIMVDVGSDFEYHIAEFQRTSSSAFRFVRTIPDYKGYTVSTGQISGDGLTFVAGIETTGDEKLAVLTRKDVDSPFEVSTLRLFKDLGEGFNDGSQPAVSAGMEWVVFMQSGSDMWEEDDLYIAQNPQVETNDVLTDHSADTAEVKPDVEEEVVEMTPVSQVEEPHVAQGTELQTPATVDAISLPSEENVTPVETDPAVETSSAKATEESYEKMPKTEFISVIYPNPASEKATIIIPNAMNATVTIAIFSSSGAEISERTETYTGSGIVIDTHEMSPGTYFVRCSQVLNGKLVSVSHKLVVER